MRFPHILRARFAIPAVFTIAAAGLMFVSLDHVLGQSGRGSSSDKRKRPDNSRWPDPPPIRLPEQATQDGDVSIRINSDLVTVVTTILRGSPNESLDLSREDFEILEDGIPQEIANFAREAEQPLQMVMLFDTSMSVSNKLDFERRAAAKFFERVMRPQDQAALFAFSTDIVCFQGFTDEVHLLVDALKQLEAQGTTSLYDAVFQAADYLKLRSGRHVIVVVSDGGDTASERTQLEALGNAQRSDVMIFAVFTGNGDLLRNRRDLAGERALGTMTSETGGTLYLPLATPGTQGKKMDEQSIKELDLAFNDLAEQLRTQYTLGSTRLTTRETAHSANSRLESRSRVTRHAPAAGTMPRRDET
jgi:Ca-activated chloride channel family protein